MAKGDINVTRAGWVLTFGNSAGSFNFDCESTTREVFERATIHGFNQKIRDAAAISRNPETGRSATAEDKLAAMRRVADSLLAGSWGVERTGATVAINLDVLIAAIVEVTGALRDKAATLVNDADGKTRAQLRDNPKVAPVYARMMADRLSEDVIADTDAMLDSLMPGE